MATNKMPAYVKKDLATLRNKVAKDRYSLIGDLWDIDKAIALLSAGKIVQAKSLLYNLDSCVQEKCTKKLYDWIEY